MDTETRPVYMLSEGHPLQTQGHIRQKMSRWKKILHANGNQEREFVSDKVEFKKKTATRDKGGHYTMIKGSV